MRLVCQRVGKEHVTGHHGKGREPRQTVSQCTLLSPTLSRHVCFTAFTWYFGSRMFSVIISISCFITDFCPLSISFFFPFFNQNRSCQQTFLPCQPNIMNDCFFFFNSMNNTTHKHTPAFVRGFLQVVDHN